MKQKITFSTQFKHSVQVNHRITYTIITQPNLS